MLGDKRATIILVLVLCFAVVSLPQIRVVKAQSIIYIRADGTVEGTDKIHREGDIYTFTENINGNVVVQRDGMILNGKEYSLKGKGGTGIHLMNRNNVRITNLEITGFDTGIYFSECYNNAIYGTEMINNANGLELHISFNNSIFFNHILNNSGFGIVLNGSEQNHIDSNVFENNSIQVQSLSSSNIWNDGTHGNFWSDYEGVDLNFDGIGDTPYIIDENNQDNYPVYVDFIPPSIHIVSPFSVAYSTSDVPLTYVLEEQLSYLSYCLDGQENVTLDGDTILTDLSEGLHDIVLFGLNGNGEDERSDRRFFTVDLSNPQITVLSIENKTYYYSEIPLSFSVNEQVSSVIYCFDGQANVSINGNTTLTGLTEGSHSLTIFAEDMAGNVGFSDTIYFTRTKAEPFPTILLVGFLFIVGVIVLFFYKMQKKGISLYNQYWTIKHE